jgi:4-carboxymuconolactone decarboxylase
MTTPETSARTYDERHRAAGEVLRAMAGPDVDVERSARAMARRHGPLGSHAIDYVLGDLWSRPQLARRDRSLVVVAVLAAMGSVDELAAHVEFGLNNGLTRDEVDEIVLQVAAYAGYPMAMAASRVVDEVFCRLDGVERQPPRQPAPAKGDAERRADAADVLRTLTGATDPVDPDQALAGLQRQFGEVGRLVFDWAFGEVWANDRLTRRDRSLVVVAILTWLSKPHELAFHVPAALNHGLSREEVTEVMVQLCVYGGFPRAIEGLRAAQEAFARLDEPGQGS